MPCAACPRRTAPVAIGSSWPPIVQEAKHAYGYTPEAPMRVIPSAAAITRMEECLDWLLLIDPEDARIVWLRAEGARWRQVCIRAGCRAIDRLAALGGRSFDDFQEAEFRSEIKAQAEGAG